MSDNFDKRFANSSCQQQQFKSIMPDLSLITAKYSLTLQKL